MRVPRVVPALVRRVRICLAALLVAASAASQATAESIEGLGALDFPTSTKSPAAQTAFVRGMLLLHVYEYPRAEKAFQDAEKLDPDFAMAYWGEAMTATHPLWNQDNPAAGRAALAKLGATPEVRAAKAGSAREKAWLGAVEAMFGPGSLAERDGGFLKAMENIAQANPNDDEAQLFLAQALLGVTRGNRNLANYLRAAEISQRVLARNPQHPGAAHYWIHGMDDPAHAASALPAARVLAKIAPDAGHAQHMVSHIFIALGMWTDVVEANERSADLIYAQERAAGKPTLACGHYPEWLQYGYYQQGRLRDARKMLDGCLRDAPISLHGSARIPASAFIWRKLRRRCSAIWTSSASSCAVRRWWKRLRQKLPFRRSWLMPMRQAVQSVWMPSASATRPPRQAMSPQRARKCSGCAKSPSGRLPPLRPCCT